MARIGNHHFLPGRVALFAAEALVIALAAGVGLRAYGGRGPTVIAVSLVVAVVLAALYLADLYDPRVARDDARVGRRLLLSLGGAVLAAMPALWLLPEPARPGLIFGLTAAVVGVTALRAVVPLGAFERRAFLVGSGPAAGTLWRELAEPGEDVIVGTSDPAAPDLADRILASGARVVVVAASDRRGLSTDALLRCRLAGLEVLEAAAYVERTRRKLAVGLLRPANLVYEDGFQRSRLADATRRALSVTTALLLAVVALPVVALFAAAIRLDSRGPVFFRQPRVGRDGRVYTMWKFRTMLVDAEQATGAVWARSRDPRVTRVGHWLRRLRLDELPQILNVLKGDMELVGPRPERPEFVAALARQIPFYGLRALVRPGITGWAQIRYPYGASVDDARQKLAYDLYYVKHASPVLDLIILFHTAKVILTARGAR